MLMLRFLYQMSSFCAFIFCLKIWIPGMFRFCHRGEYLIHPFPNQPRVKFRRWTWRNWVRTDLILMESGNSGQMEIKSGLHQKWTPFTGLGRLGRKATRPRKKADGFVRRRSTDGFPQSLRIDSQAEGWVVSWLACWWSMGGGGPSHNLHRPSKLQQGWEVPPPPSLPHQKQFPPFGPPEQTHENIPDSSLWIILSICLGTSPSKSRSQKVFGEFSGQRALGLQIQIHLIICWYVPICANMCWYVPICTNMYRYVPICAEELHICQYTPTYAIYAHASFWLNQAPKKNLLWDG